MEDDEPPRWERLFNKLLDKRLVPRIDNRKKHVLVNAIKYPGASQVGEAFFRKLSTELPNLTVQQLMVGCRKICENDVCEILQEHLNRCQQHQQQLLCKNISYDSQKDLEKLIGFTHFPQYCPRRNSWKLLAEVSGMTL